MVFAHTTGPARPLAGARRDHINDAFEPEKTGCRPARTRCRRVRLGWGRITSVPTRLIGLRRGVAAMACGLAGVLGAALAMPDAAQAQGKLDARYVVTLAGLPIGRGAWIIDINNDEYTAVANGKTTGLLSIISNGEGTTAARGHVVRGNLVPSTYVSTITSDRSSRGDAGDARGRQRQGVGDRAAAPAASRPHPGDRGASQERHRPDVGRRSRGSPAPGMCCRPRPATARSRCSTAGCATISSSPTSAWTPSRPTRATQGPAVVCAIYFVPIAGYIPDRKAIKYLIAQRDMEVWLVPIAGTRFVVPYRLCDPDAARPGRAGGDPVRRDAAADRARPRR